MSHLGKKRLEAVLAVATYAVGSGCATAAPTPGVELPKQLILTTSDIIMYTRVWKIYFEEDLSSQGLLEMLVELGLVTVAATGTAYIVGKASTAILKEITSWTGPLGWGVLAAISGSITGLFGAAWASYCDHIYSQREYQARSF